MSDSFYYREINTTAVTANKASNGSEREHEHEHEHEQEKKKKHTRKVNGKETEGSTPSATSALVVVYFSQ